MRISVSVTPVVSAARRIAGAAGTKAAAVAAVSRERLRNMNFPFPMSWPNVLAQCLGGTVPDLGEAYDRPVRLQDEKRRPGKPRRRRRDGSGRYTLDDVAEQLPDLAVPAHQPQLSDRMIVGRAGVDADAGQQH